jgi:glycerophosphoryl diester phosphodiesterase
MPFAGLTGDAVPPELRIVTLEEAFAYLESSGPKHYIIEIKNGGETGYRAADILYDTLVRYDALQRTVVGTFHNEITAYMDETYPDMLRSAGFNEAIKFYLCSFFGLRRDKSDFGFDALQIPTTDYVVNLGTSKVINYAHKLDIAVQYWTINTAEEMEYLQSVGADTIMTDRPDIGADTLNRPR